MKKRVDNTTLEEQITQIPISELHPFPNHPFKVLDDERMAETVGSIHAHGVLLPIIVRPMENGYEIISGHRRKRACELLGMETMPAIVRNMTNEEAVILMADSNLQRENVLPSERAYAYKMKLDAMKKQGNRTDLTSCQVGTKLRTDGIMAEQAEESARTIQRYIRLTNLIPQMMELVDRKKLAFNPAVELSYLTSQEQQLLLDALDKLQCSPSLSQAQRMKQFSREKRLTVDVIDAILSEAKKQSIDRISFDRGSFAKFFPKSYSVEQMQKTIITLLTNWQKKKQKEQER